MMLTKMDITVIKNWEMKQRELAKKINASEPTISWKKKEVRGKINSIVDDYKKLLSLGVIDDEGNINDDYRARRD